MKLQGILFLLIYAAIMITATMIFTKRAKTGESFHVADRSMGPVVSAMSIAATWIWAPALFTSAEKAYSNGLAGLFWFLVPNVVCLLVFIPFAKKIRKEMPQGITLSGYMYERYHSKAAKNAYLFELSMLSILSTAVQLLAGGKIMSMTTGLSFPFVTVALAAIAYAYSQFSGIRASVLTDVLQMLFMLAACILFVPWALKLNGGWSAVKLSGITGEYGSLFGQKGLEVFLGFGLPTAIGLISGPFGDQCFWQRAFCIKESKITKAFVLGALFFAVVPLSMGILGFIAAGTGFIPKDAGTVNLELIQAILPAWVLVPFMYMLISGLMSTVDSDLCAAASLTTDITKDNGTGIPKAAMLLILGIGIAIANIPGITVTKMFLIYGTLRATTLLPTILTLTGKKLTGNGVAAGVITAMSVGLPIFAYGTVKNLSGYKTAGSLLSVLLAGFVAILVSRRKEAAA